MGAQFPIFSIRLEFHYNSSKSCYYMGVLLAIPVKMMNCWGLKAWSWLVTSSVYVSVNVCVGGGGGKQLWCVNYMVPPNPWNLCKVKVKACDWPTCRNILHGNKRWSSNCFSSIRKKKKTWKYPRVCGASSLQIFIFCMTYFYREVKVKVLVA